MTNNKKKRIDWTTFTRLLQLIFPYRRLFIIAMIMGLLLSILSPFKPQIVNVAIEENIESDKGIGLLNMSLIYLGVLIAEAVLFYFYRYLAQYVAQNVIKDLRVRVYNHISNLQLSFYNQNPIGKLTTRTINDVEALNKTFSDGLINMIQDVLKIIFVVVFMFTVNWQFALLTLVPFPFILFATYVFKEKVKGAFQQVRQSVQDLNSFMQEHISGMKIVQLFAIEKLKFGQFNAINNKNKQANVDAVNYYAVYFPVIEILSATALALLIWYGGHLAQIDRSYVSEIAAFYMWSTMLFRPLRMLADRFNTLQMGLIASERVFHMLDSQQLIEQGSYEPTSIQGNIEFKNVTFGYNESESVLRNVSFFLQAGQSMAIVGSTGSGKSTTIQLINRLYDTSKGEVLIDGKNVQEYDLQALRSRIANVQQDVFLFSGSVYENIVMNETSISKQNVIDAAKEVGVHEFIETLPGGYDYKVMERGATLSTGQRQLISFIRAMVTNPDLLILDEATASIDTETELLLQKATERLMKGRTSIVIAHRLSTIQHASKIVVLDKGEIIESGTHQELLDLNGSYAQLHDLQFGLANI